MDDIKDLQKTENIAKFLDVRNVRVNPFGDNRAADRAYRRAERIVAGIHLVTNHISVHEPLRNQIRAESTQLLSEVMNLRDEMRSAQSYNVISVLSVIRKLISLVRLLGISGFVSAQNSSALHEALDELGNFIHVSQRTNFSESVSLSREEMLDVGGSYHRPMTHMSRDEKDVREVMQPSVNAQVVATTVRTESVNGQANSRARNIMEILRSGGEMAIKDICSNLPEYSEKMIQRELLSLVNEGKVKKTGLKRWSRYSLA